MSVIHTTVQKRSMPQLKDSNIRQMQLPSMDITAICNAVPDLVAEDFENWECNCADTKHIAEYDGKTYTCLELAAVQGLRLLSTWRTHKESATPCSSTTGSVDGYASSGDHGGEDGVDSDPSQDYTPSKGSSSKAKKSRKRSRTKEQDPSEVTGKAFKKVKQISAAAEASRAFCLAIKRLEYRDLPEVEPPKSVFDRFDAPVEVIGKTGTFSQGPFPTTRAESFDEVAAKACKVNPRHPTLAQREQRFLAGLRHPMSEQTYQECKRRIFVCARWRTEEDGITHTKEASQQSCSINVNVVSLMHEWFDNMQLFHQPWRLDETASTEDGAKKAERPPGMSKPLRKVSEGRNGRPYEKNMGTGKPRVLPNIPIATIKLAYPPDCPDWRRV